MTYNIAVLPGDGIGPEVMQQALLVLESAGQAAGCRFSARCGLAGGSAWEKTGSHLPAETLQLCNGFSDSCQAGKLTITLSGPAQRGIAQALNLLRGGT
jgi:isocitrate/isopropylmalate dehydrogenase